MADVDLRPLSLGEVLDRTFSLYRRNFLVFLGISALPHLLVLALRLVQAIATPGLLIRQTNAFNALAAFGPLGLVLLVVRLIAYILAQGGTVTAVSEIYMGRPTTIWQAMQRLRGELGNLFGVLVLNGLLVFGGPIVCFATGIVAGAPIMAFLGVLLFFFPGIYFACRLMVVVPAALLENIGPRSSVERSFELTRGRSGRAFVIYILYFILLIAAAALMTWPASAGLVASGRNPATLRFWLSLVQVGDFAAQVLVEPFLMIAAAIFYYDLRVRKEGFDLQVMLNPSGRIATGTAGVPSMFS